MGYNCIQVKTHKLVCRQMGVFRTNCLDCLDRTNYIQSRIGLRAVKHFVERFGQEEVHSLSIDGKLLSMPINNEFPLLKGFNSLWADNGDAISLLYTGIGSTHTE
jgi:synaptojanin